MREDARVQLLAGRDGRSGCPFDQTVNFSTSRIEFRLVARAKVVAVMAVRQCLGAREFSIEAVHHDGRLDRRAVPIEGEAVRTAAACLAKVFDVPK
jgi:hypothetical protein